MALDRRQACMRRRPASFTAAPPIELTGNPYGEADRQQSEQKQSNPKTEEFGGQTLMGAHGYLS
jgi:hypothetical protein